HALADLGASINLMPLSIWKKLSLPELTPTRMTLELADRSITYPKGLAEDVFVKVRKFHFLTDFVVVDFEADTRVPLILGRSFLRTGRALINVYGEEITLRVDNEAVTFNLDQTTRYSSTNDKSINRIDIIDAVFEEYALEFLGFPNPSGGNPTPTSEPFTSEFILEEIEAYLKDDSISPEIDHANCDPEEDICLIEKLLNNDPFQLPPMDLKQSEVTEAKSSIEEPPELELKDLPCHLEYVFLEENDKLPVIIAKGLKNDEKDALLKVLKSHKSAIAWKITDIKGIDPRFCTHKILMEDDYKPTVQSQRRVNPKIYEVIKKEVLKLLDAGMIYPISNSPWVSPMHCVPKKGGITVVANEENELISTRYFQIPIDPQDQEKTTFTCLYGTFAYRHMPFGLCNAPGTFQRCMIAIFHDMIEKTMEVFMDDFSVFGDSFDSCLSNLEKMLKRCEDTNLTLKKKLTEAPVLVVPDWNLPFELMCDARDFAIGAVLGQRKMKHFQPIHYASKIMTEAQIHYTTTEKEMLAVVYAFEKFRPYLVLSKSIVYTDHSALKYLMNKQDAKPRLLRWVLLLQEFDITIRDKKGSENLAADHLSRLENPHKDVLENKDINEHFPLETLRVISSESTPWMIPIFFVLVRIKSFDGVCMARSSMKSSKLVHEGPTGAIICQSHVLEKQGKISQTEKMPQNAVKFVEIFGCMSKGAPINDAGTYENSLIYKERTKKLHDSKIKNRIFNVGDRVLLFNSRLKIFSEKLKTRWSGPFTITKVFPYGTIELSQPDGPNFKVNGHRVKHYFRGDLPPKDEPKFSEDSRVRCTDNAKISRKRSKPDKHGHENEKENTRAGRMLSKNRSLVIPRHEKTPYHIINGRKPSVKFFYIFGSLCYIVRDGENLNKIKEKCDACIFVGYSTQSRAYRVYNKRTRVIFETIHVNFDELPQMASNHVSSDPVPQCRMTALEHASLSPGPQSQENVPHSDETVTTSNELDLLFSLMFDELLNGTTLVVSKSSTATTANAPNQRQHKNTTSYTSTTVAVDIPPLNIQTTTKTTSQAPTVTANENIIQAETNKEYAQVDEDEFINIFSTPVQE
ncbi:reverse transcriptase domain-containing protein, partial [Tanacetum coccineum]